MAQEDTPSAGQEAEIKKNAKLRSNCVSLNKLWFGCSHWPCWQLLGHTAVGSGVVVVPPLEGVLTKVWGRQRERHRDRFGVFSQAKADASNPARRVSRCVVATWLVDKGLEGRPDRETVAWVWRAGTDRRSSSGAVVRQATLGLEAGRPCLD